eukprot:1143043-Pelagomonas_calceolata.AAC.2
MGQCKRTAAAHGAGAWKLPIYDICLCCCDCHSICRPWANAEVQQLLMGPEQRSCPFLTPVCAAVIANQNAGNGSMPKCGSCLWGRSPV